MCCSKAQGQDRQLHSHILRPMFFIGQLRSYHFSVLSSIYIFMNPIMIGTDFFIQEELTNG